MVVLLDSGSGTIVAAIFDDAASIIESSSRFVWKVISISVYMFAVSPNLSESLPSCELIILT